MLKFLLINTNLKFFYERPMKENVSDLGAKIKNDLKYDEPVYGNDSPNFFLQIKNIGFGSQNMYQAYKKLLEMKNTKVLLCYTSNIISSGLRDLILNLVKNDNIHSILTTGGGIEEDIIKTMGNTYLADFKLSGQELRENGYNRIGNLVIPNENYELFEKFLYKILDKMDNKVSVCDFTRILGKNSPGSILHECYLKNIPVFASGIIDGSIGDILTFYKNKEIEIDLVKDSIEFNNNFNNNEWSVIILGDGVIRSRIFNKSRKIKNSIIITTRENYDGSDVEGTLPENTIKIFGDATIIFPMLMKETFLKNKY